jgi:hypothetical protein
MRRRVRLLTDLTRYHPAFVEGVTGEADEVTRTMNDNFFWMQLDSGERLEVLWKSVDVRPRLTDEGIGQLKRAALERDDQATAYVCEAALLGDRFARDECERRRGPSW